MTVSTALTLLTVYHRRKIAIGYRLACFTIQETELGDYLLWLRRWGIHQFHYTLLFSLFHYRAVVEVVCFFVDQQPITGLKAIQHFGFCI